MIGEEEQKKIERIFKGSGLSRLVLIGKEDIIAFVEQEDVGEIAHLLR